MFAKMSQETGHRRGTGHACATTSSKGTELLINSYWSIVRVQLLCNVLLASAVQPRESDVASLVAQLVKNLPAMQETPVRFLGWEDLLETG